MTWRRPCAGLAAHPATEKLARQAALTRSSVGIVSAVRALDEVGGPPGQYGCTASQPLGTPLAQRLGDPPITLPTPDQLLMHGGGKFGGEVRVHNREVTAAKIPLQAVVCNVTFATPLVKQTEGSGAFSERSIVVPAHRRSEPP